MIKKVILKHFKALEDETFDLDSNIVLAGQNNSGKTTVIQAISAWYFGLQKWQASGKSKHGVPVGRKDFSPVPLQEFSQLWTNKSTGYKKDEEPGKYHGAPRPLVIKVVGEDESGEWSVEVEFKYSNKDQIYVKSNHDANKIPNGAKNLQVVYIPSFSGISIEEHEVNRAYQDTLIGQGKPGDILRNLLQEISVGSKSEWEELCAHVEEIFNYELTTPSSPGAAFILCQYRRILSDGTRTLPLDINTAGSGFQQVLLLLAFLYARPGSVVLIDEPDAHLHVNLQSKIYDTIENIIYDRGGRLIVATHSEELIDATSPEQIISFFGKHPHKLSDTHDRKKLQSAIRKLRATDLLKAEQCGDRILFVEGKTDLDILRAWAKTLKHPMSKNWFDKKESYWWDMKGDHHKEAPEVFEALQAVSANFKGFVVVDSDGKKKNFSTNKQNIKLKVWNRYEIENYLVHPQAIVRLITESPADKQLSVFAPPGQKAENPQKAEEELRKIMPPDYFSAPVNDPSGYLISTKASELILPRVFDAANYKINKNKYYRLAEVMEPDEIHNDVREMLDAIAEYFGIS